MDKRHGIFEIYTLLWVMLTLACAEMRSWGQGASNGGTLITILLDGSGEYQTVLIVTSKGIYLKQVEKDEERRPLPRTHFLQGADTNSVKVELEYVIGVEGSKLTTNSNIVRGALDTQTGKVIETALNEDRVTIKALETLLRTIAVDKTLVREGLPEDLLRQSHIKKLMGLEEPPIAPVTVDWFAQLTNRVIVFGGHVGEFDASYAFAKDGVYLESRQHRTVAPPEHYFLALPSAGGTRTKINRCLDSILNAKYPYPRPWGDEHGCVRNNITVDANIFVREEFRYRHLGALHKTSIELYELIKLPAHKIERLPEDLVRLKGVQDLFRGAQ